MFEGKLDDETKAAAGDLLLAFRDMWRGPQPPDFPPLEPEQLAAAKLADKELAAMVVMRFEELLHRLHMAEGRARSATRGARDIPATIP